MAPPSSTTLDTETRPLVRVGGMPRVQGRGPLGALSELMRDQFGALRRWQRDYGGVFEMKLGPASFVIAADANTASEMLVERSQIIERGGGLYAPMEQVFGQSLLTTEGKVWRERRRSAQPHFRQRAITAMSERIDAALQDALSELRPGVCDVYAFSGRLSMTVALSVMFGRDLSELDFAELSAAIEATLKSIGLGWVASRLPRWLPIPGSRHFRRQLGVLDRVVFKMIEDRRTSGEYGDDILGMLLHMSDGGALTNQNIRDEAVGLIMAGYETTANSIGWALYELAKDPAMHARVRAEADGLASGGSEGDPRALAYTRRVFKEAMRMYPSAIWLPRNASEDTTLAGYPVAAKTPVVCSIYLVHHDPHAWPEPERFDPERFVEGSNQPRNRHAFMPFGLGQHKCIGQHLAMLEGPLALAYIAQSWDLAPVPGREPVMTISTTMSAKDGIELQLTPRESAAQAA